MRRPGACGRPRIISLDVRLLRRLVYWCVWYTRTDETAVHIHLDPTDGRPIYQQIVDEVRRAVALGTVAPDEPLPSVRALAVALRVNPNTVQQAYRELERAGVVYSRRGQGTFVLPAAAEGERASLLRDVAARALADARRYGIDPADLARALLAASPSPFEPAPPS